MKRRVFHSAGLFAVMALAPRLAAWQPCGGEEGPRLPPLKLSENRRFLVSADGKPFFWLGDTAWWLREVPPESVDHYLANRAGHGFNIIQVHCGYDGATARPAADFAGNPPFLGGDPGKPNEPFWRTIDEIVAKAGRARLYVALVPMWGGEYGRAFGTDREKARRFGRWIGNRYSACSHVVWVVSGEYAEINNFKYPVREDQKAVFNAAAGGLRDAHSGAQLMTIHPGGARSSSEDFHQQAWLDFNMIQSGHFIDSRAWQAPENCELVSSDYARRPVKPVIDGEPIYEDTPDAVWKVKHVEGPRAGADVVRRKAYWAVFSGAFGHTYGHNDVYGFFEPSIPGQVLTLKSKPSGPGQRGSWRAALDAPGASQMKYLRSLMESRPFLTRVPDRSLVGGALASGDGPVVGTRDDRGGYAMIYTPTARRLTVRLDRLKGPEITGWWFNPRSGGAARIGVFPRGREREFTPPAEGDWVLVLDASSRAAPPGQKNASDPFFHRQREVAGEPRPAAK